ncbi:unnamed protein product [Peronospora belbahrii]|uniref:Secreted protein n=1 Tax=Peronospora belbahrii TaxID=622444 RepID=A0AAU9L3X3_9STRA|nr:unnamed protein product [Peronospora belbahrii]
MKRRHLHYLRLTRFHLLWSRHLPCWHCLPGSATIPCPGFTKNDTAMPNPTNNLPSIGALTPWFIYPLILLRILSLALVTSLSCTD